ncbi:energy transducer TonB [Pedobacter sp. SD-b]|uniref:Energy transducer TonB n=1 Tax=Pedobacter segetis TaxID=2793069 RepID=A0ABS1BM37_9SPHI|nr:energy transducer TonB [Pedobacter segetis]MBK0383958.1 energy transducer TonB [Pedobacter segetis]
MIALNQKNPDNNYPKAIAISIAILVALLLLSIFYIVSKATPPEEVGVGGIIVNYGTSDVGMGNDYMSVEDPSVDPNANGKAPDKITPNKEVTQNSQAVNSDNNIVTDDNSDAVSLNNKAKATNNAPTQKTEDKPKAPVINQNALYKGNKNKGTGTGDGTGDQAGNQGKKEGDPLSDNYNGSGSGNGGVALSLASRRFVNLPSIKDDGQKSGKVVVEIRVDKNGNVTSAKAGGRGTTLTDPTLWDKCETAALGSRFNTLESAPDTQIGTIVFNFKVK